MKTSKVAENFLSYYKLKAAKVLPSSPLIHPLFPMSFNMSAGLVQLDPILRDQKVIHNKQMVVVQKCFRHFDVKKVTSTSHLSFFEMGGYFEVGKFNKERILSYIYDFLVSELKIDADKLWVTVFAGDEIYGRKFPEDKDVFKIWRELLPNRKQIIYFNKNNNFWLQGGGTEIAIESKLCGPQTEIFFDLGKTECKENQCLPNCPCGRFLELSNILFITHKLTSDLRIESLTNKAIESVIGIERVVAMIEKRKSVYEIEDIHSLVKELISRDNGLTNSQSLQRRNRIIDHIRALVFLISEGAPPPGKNGRARIIRTLIRELLTDFYFLNLDSQKLIPLLVNKVIEEYSPRYPELQNSNVKILNMIFDHEEIYLKTLEKVGGRMQRYLVKNNKTRPDEKDRIYFREQFGIPIELQKKYLTYDRNN
jgi:alanyl-tRNA synthetase